MDIFAFAVIAWELMARVPIGVVAGGPYGSTKAMAKYAAKVRQVACNCSMPECLTMQLLMLAHTAHRTSSLPTDIGQLTSARCAFGCYILCLSIID